MTKPIAYKCTNDIMHNNCKSHHTFRKTTLAWMLLLLVLLLHILLQYEMARIQLHHEMEQEHATLHGGT